MSRLSMFGKLLLIFLFLLGLIPTVIMMIFPEQTRIFQVSSTLSVGLSLIVAIYALRPLFEQEGNTDNCNKYRDKNEKLRCDLISSVYKQWKPLLTEIHYDFKQITGTKININFRAIDNGRIYNEAILSSFFEQYSEGRLIISGAPGSGKTVLQLQLLMYFLELAKPDNRLHIPIMLNLTTWAANPKPLRTWVINEMKKTYGVAKRASEDLLGSSQLVLILDGLDEVASDFQIECVNAINTYVSETYDIRIVISCRSHEEDDTGDVTKTYSILLNSLDQFRQIELVPLSLVEVEKTLKESLPADTANQILPVLKSNPIIERQLTKPLFVNIILRTYYNGMRGPMPNFRLEANPIQKYLIEPYINEQLRGVINPKPQFTRDYLSWLAWNMRSKEMTVFYVEVLQENWLSKKLYIRALKFGGSLILVALMLLSFTFALGIAGILAPDLGGWLVLGLLDDLGYGIPLIFGYLVLFTFMPIDLEQRITFRHFSAYETLYLLFGLHIFNFSVLILNKSIQSLDNELVVDYAGNASYTLAFVLAGIGSYLTIQLRGETSIQQRRYLNEGLRDTFSVGLIITLTFAIIFGFIVSVISAIGLQIDMARGLIVGTAMGLAMGIILGLVFGLGSVLKHLILRLLLGISKTAPWLFKPFIEHITDRRLARQVGGGVQFVHRYVLDYFADHYHQQPEETQVQSPMNNQ